MERIRLLTEVKVKAATERCDALLASIEKLQNKVIPSPATRAVIEAISTGVVTLKTRLKELTNDQELQYLNDAEIELKVHKNTQHLPYFHVILGLVGPSDVLSIPPELAAPLRRQMKSLFGNKVETMITSAADLNYTITEISSALRALLEQLNANPPDVFPDRIFVVSIPVVEYDNALLHCILAHEMGHPLLEASSIMEHALAKAQIDQAKLQEIIDTITDRAGRVGGKQSQVTIEDVLLKAEIVKAVTEAIPNWVTEVSADLFGVLLFGPAYFFVHFSSAFLLLDSASTSHPPSRLRLKYIFMLFDKIYDSGRKFSANTIAFLDGWRRIAVAPIVLDHPVSTLALNSMERSEFMEFLVDQVSKSLPEVHHYTSDRYSKDIGNLVPLADASIPPIEWLSPTEGFQQADPVAVLNVGWECFLGGLGKYGKALRSDDDIPDFKVSQRFNALVMKSLELIEIRKTWEEANAFVGGPNPQSDS